MLRNCCMATILLTLVATNAFGQAWARKMFKETEYDFGSVAKNALVEHRFELSNIYMEDVHIVSVSSTCGCTTPRIEKPDLKTYEHGAIVAHFNTDRFTGDKGATLTVTFDRPYYAQVQLHVRGHIRSDVEFQPGSVNFGTLEEGMGAEQRVSMSYYGGSNWRIEDLKTSSPHISAQAVQRQRYGGQVVYDLIVRADDRIPAGYLDDRIVVVSSSGGYQQQIPLKVVGRVTSGITVSPSALFMGVVEPGKTVTRKLVIHGKKPFRVVNVTCEDGNFHADLPDPTVAKTTHIVPVTFVADGKTGRVSEKIKIQTDHNNVTSTLAAHAVVTDPTVN